MVNNKKVRMAKEKKAGIIITTLVVIVVLTSIVYLYGNLNYSDFVNEVIGFFSIMIALVSAILIVVQLRDTKKIQEAEFVVNLNQCFVENQIYAHVYTELENMDLKNMESNLKRIEISNYLTFFESMYLLLKQKVITIDILDDLFAYRFFLAIHNEDIQEKKLVSAPYNFRNIYYLEHKWMKYRREKGLPIYKEENCLEKSCEKAGKSEVYKDIIKKIERE